MNTEPWIGDAVTENDSTCNFSSGPLGEGPRCTNPATLHIRSESAIHGVVSLATCDTHAEIARGAGLNPDEHPYGPGCEGDFSYWTTEGYCLPDPGGAP